MRTSSACGGLRPRRFFDAAPRSNDELVGGQDQLPWRTALNRGVRRRNQPPTAALLGLHGLGGLEREHRVPGLGRANERHFFAICQIGAKIARTPQIAACLIASALLHAIEQVDEMTIFQRERLPLPIQIKT